MTHGDAMAFKDYQINTWDCSRSPDLMFDFACRHISRFRRDLPSCSYRRMWRLTAVAANIVYEVACWGENHENRNHVSQQRVELENLAIRYAEDLADFEGFGVGWKGFDGFDIVEHLHACGTALVDFQDMYMLHNTDQLPGFVRYLFQRNLMSQYADAIRDLAGDTLDEIHPSDVAPYVNADVSCIAKDIYAERLWCDVGVLADALLDAGMLEDSAIVRHFRSNKRHYRGCWALDLILDRWFHD